MRAAIIVPVVALLAGALLCLALRPADTGAGTAGRSAPGQSREEQDPQSATDGQPDVTWIT